MGTMGMEEAVMALMLEMVMDRAAHTYFADRVLVQKGLDLLLVVRSLGALRKSEHCTRG